jgi:cytidylate kinase
MKITETAAGTQIVERTPEEYDAYLERQVQREMGMSVAEFERAYAADELDDADVAVDYVVSLLRIGQNGHQPAS